MGEFKAPAAQQNKTATPVQAPKEASSLGETEYVDSRASTFQFIQLQAAADDKGKGNRITQLQSKSTQFTRFSQVAQLQAKRDSPIPSTQSPVVQREENKTGLPDGLKSGMESLSGLSLNDVKVHRNSDKPAQLQAHAYAQGTDIHLAPGQEKHLPHELGHVVQQKEGRVKPTVQLKDKVNINDDSGLEKEADVFGEKAHSISKNTEKGSEVGVVQQKEKMRNEVLQGKFVQANLIQLASDGSKKGGSNLKDHGTPATGEVFDIPIPEDETPASDEVFDIPVWAQQREEEIEIFDVPNTEIRELPKDESIYDEDGNLLGKAKDFIRDYAATQVSKSTWITNEKGEYAYSVSTKNKALMAAVSSGVGAYDAGDEVAKQVKYTMDPEKVTLDAKKAENVLSGLGKIDLESIPNINIVTKYFEILETLDVFGVTNILKSIGSIAFAWREKSKIAVLKQQVGMVDVAYLFPEELTEVAEYALAKVTRSYYTSMAQGILEAIQGITRIITTVTGGISGIFTESINLASNLVQKTLLVYHMVKGIFKFFKGTKGVARKANAEKVFDLCAKGDFYALDFLKDYFEAGLPMLQTLAIAQLRSKKMTPEIEKNVTDLANAEIELFFTMLKENESIPEIKILKNFVIDRIANEFKSKPPSGSALFQVVLKQEAVQNGLADAFNKATST